MTDARGIVRRWRGADELLDGVDAVIFDNDGTLVDTMPVHMGAWQHALAQHGIAFPAARFYALAGMSSAEIVALLAREQGVCAPPLQDVLRARAAHMRARGARFAGLRPVAPVLAVLHEARRRGLRVAVASGGEREDVVASLVAAGVVAAEDRLGDVFGAVVTTEDVVKGKPDPETFLTAAARLGVEPGRCVGLEDGELGLTALLGAGMRAVDVRLHDDYPLDDGLKRVIAADVDARTGKAD